MTGEHGTLFIVTAPSGAGKTTLLRRLTSDLPNLSFSVSHTTRAPRQGEVNGTDYFFVDRKHFEDYRDEHAFLEWAVVHNHYYGTSRKAVEDQLAQGVDVVLDIDVAGADQVRKKMPGAISIFIVPPSLDELRKRLIDRNKDSQEVIERRVRNAKMEIRQVPEFNYLVVNDDLETCYRVFRAVFLAARAETARSLKKIERMIANCF